MTSTTSGIRRTVFAASAAAALLALSACGAGQHTQTSTQVAAVDGGSGSSANVIVNDVRVVLPEKGQEGEPSVAFVAAYKGANIGSIEGIRLESLTIDGKRAQIAESKPLSRNCSLIAAVKEGAEQPNKDSVPKRNSDPCMRFIEVTVPGDDLDLGHSTTAEFRFQGEQPITVHAGVVASREESGKFTRPVETEAPQH